MTEIEELIILVAVMFFLAVYYMLAKVMHKNTFDEAYQLGKKHGAENNELHFEILTKEYDYIARSVEELAPDNPWYKGHPDRCIKFLKDQMDGRTKLLNDDLRLIQRNAELEAENARLHIENIGCLKVDENKNYGIRTWFTCYRCGKYVCVDGTFGENAVCQNCENDVIIGGG